MSAAEGPRMLEWGLGFFSVMSRSLSHDINNVLATVSQLSGLIDDFAYAAKQGKPLDPERLTHTVMRIGKQVERGKAQTTMLNRFAHSVDEQHAPLELGHSVAEVVAMCQRFARLRRMTLEAEPGARAVTVVGSCFHVEHAVYRAIETVLHASADGEALAVSVEPSGGGGRVTVRAAGEARPEGLEAAHAQLATLEAIAATFGIGVEAELAPGAPARLVLAFPGELQR